MGAFFVYILKSSVCLALFYFFYRVLLSKDTFHRTNRVALIGMMLLSLVIPLCEITIKQNIEVQQTVFSWEQLLLIAMANEHSVSEIVVPSVSWRECAILIYFAGFLFFCFRYLYSLLCLFNLIRLGKKEKIKDGFVLVVHDGRLAPFSWMKYIVISKKDLEENGREILLHETAHIRNKHSIDLLMADICLLFQWYNPAVWALKNELQDIHEYEADANVLNQGVDAKEYQLLLIRRAVGVQHFASISNSFNRSPLKKRIMMMSKKKSSSWAKLKYLYIVPLMAVVVAAFARPEITEELNEISFIEIDNLKLPEMLNYQSSEIKVAEDTVILITNQSLQEKEASKEALMEKEDDSSMEIEEQVKSNVDRLNQKVGNAFPKKNTIELLDELNEAERKKRSPIPNESLQFKGIGNDNMLENMCREHVVYIDGVEASRKDLENLSQDNIYSIEIQQLNNNENRRKKGALLIITKDGKKSRGNASSFNRTGVELKIRTDNAPARSSFDSKEKENGPLFVLNGKVVDHSILHTLNPNTIESMSVLKRPEEIKQYGQKGKHGVVLINTKDATMSFPDVVLDDKKNNFSFIETSKSKNGFFLRGVKNGVAPLIYVDGKEFHGTMDDLDVNTIESISILKEETAVEQYGEKGKKGVIKVITKKM